MYPTQVLGYVNCLQHSMLPSMYPTQVLDNGWNMGLVHSIAMSIVKIIPGVS